jgi:hypothetical protein
MFGQTWAIFLEKRLATLVPSPGTIEERGCPDNHIFCARIFISCKLEQRKDRQEQGCQMAYFQTKNPYLGKLWYVGIFYDRLEY